MRFYKGTDQYVVAVTAREEVSLLLLLGYFWVGLGSWTPRNLSNNMDWNNKKVGIRRKLGY